MKKKAIIALAAAVLAVLVIALAVGIVLGRGNSAEQNEYEKQLLGKWAYIHDPDTEAASFQKNGGAKLEGEKYTFSCDGARIRLTDKGGKVSELRYLQNGEKMYLYIQSNYVLENGGKPEGIEGLWVCPEKNWTFEFTGKGTFMEDGVLTGHYFIDEENGTVRLVYGDGKKVMDDTVLYYRLTDEGLFVEYPWLMEKMK